MKEKIKIDKTLIVPVVLIAVLISMVAFYLQQVSVFEQNRKQIASKVKSLQSIYKRTDKIPSIKQVELIRSDKVKLNDVLKKYKYTYNKMVTHEEPYERLAFKLKLKELTDNYAKYKIPIPEGIGFKEYLGAMLPDLNKMQELSRQLAFIIQIINILIENSVEAILDIQRGGVEVIKNSSGEKTFKAYNFTMEFKVSYDNVLLVMDTLATLNNIIKIKNVSFNSNYKPGDFSLDSQLVDTEIQIIIIEAFTD